MGLPLQDEFVGRLQSEGAALGYNGTSPLRHSKDALKPPAASDLNRGERPGVIRTH